MQQCQSNCFKWPPYAQTQAPSLSLLVDCLSTARAREVTFWHYGHVNRSFYLLTYLLCWKLVHVLINLCSRSATSCIGVWWTRSGVTPQVQQKPDWGLHEWRDVVGSFTNPATAVTQAMGPSMSMVMFAVLLPNILGPRTFSLRRSKV